MDYSTENQRMRTLDAYNLRAVGLNACAGLWDMPVLEPVDVCPGDMTGFNYAMTASRTASCVHFFVDDYQFERCWRRPDAYTARLGQFQAAATPDFSLYRDMPLPMQMWNVYRSRTLGHYWQQNGVTIVPTLQWSTPDTYEWALGGIPQGGTVIVSRLGCRQDPEADRLWRMGMTAALDIVRPGRVLLHGAPPPDFDWGDTECVVYRDRMNDRLEGLHHGRKR